MKICEYLKKNGMTITALALKVDKHYGEEPYVHVKLTELEGIRNDECR